MSFLMVAAGGAVGSVLRYGLSLIPFRQGFPFATLLANFLGAVLIGLIAANAGRLPGKSVLLLKTGLCGGFTTFSTFSLESVQMLQDGRVGIAILYMGLSLVLSLLGVGLGLWLGGIRQN